MKLINLSPKERKIHQAKPLEEKIKTAQTVISLALKEFGPEHSAIAWTGGKDSTLLLWLARQVVNRENLRMPKIMFVDEGDVFEEIWQFTRDIIQKWQLDFSITHNADVSSKAKKIGDPVRVADLNKRNQEEVRRLGFTEETFPYEPESFIGNHLMKTVATNLWIEEQGMKSLMVGVRWDEQEARAEDDFLRYLQKPDHARIEPILAFTEADVWETIKNYGIPYVKLYEQGYRSLGARTTTTKMSELPAWQQDSKNTAERAGRRQDKEKIMKRLRDLGYM